MPDPERRCVRDIAHGGWQYERERRLRRSVHRAVDHGRAQGYRLVLLTLEVVDDGLGCYFDEEGRNEPSSSTPFGDHRQQQDE